MPLNSFQSVYLPYCLLQQPDGRYAILNREYKPLGFRTKAHVNYEDFPVLVEFKGLTKKLASQISCNGSDTTAQIFLYDDSSVPISSTSDMNSYLRRLGLLAKLDVIEQEL